MSQFQSHVTVWLIYYTWARAYHRAHVEARGQPSGVRSPRLSRESQQTKLWFSGLVASTFVCWVISPDLFGAQLTNLHTHTHTPGWQIQVTEPTEEMNKVKEIAVLTGYPDDKTSFTLGWIFHSLILLRCFIHFPFWSSMCHFSFAANVNRLPGLASPEETGLLHLGET